MSTNQRNLVLLLLMGILSLLLGLFVGTKLTKEPEVKTVTEVRYIKGDTIVDSVYVDRPVVVKPDTLDFLKACLEAGLVPKDTVQLTIRDTIMVLNDWASKKHYEQTLWSTDTTGTCTVAVDLQYNNLQNLSYQYTPVYRQTSTVVVKQRLFQPYVGAGISTSKDWLVSAGAIFHQHYGVMATYQQPFGVKDPTIALQALYVF